MKPDALPERYLQVAGYTRVGGNEYMVEWRDTAREQTARVWIRLTNDRRWVVNYEVDRRRSAGYDDHGGLGTYTDFRAAVEAAVDVMRRTGSGASRDPGIDHEFDFTGGGL